MKRILKIGMNIHTTNYTLCAMEPIIGEADSVFETIKVTSDYKNILLFQNKLVDCLEKCLIYGHIRRFAN